MDRERCRELGFDVDAFLETPASTSYDNEAETFLYVLQCGEYVKVGIAKDIKKRLDSFQIGNPFPIAVLKSSRFRSRLYALLVERTIHRVLSDERHFGEWFVCAPEKAKEVATLVSGAMRLLEVQHRRQVIAKRHAWQDRYDNDPEFRAKLDADREAQKKRLTLWQQRDAAEQAAAEQFDSETNNVLWRDDY